MGKETRREDGRASRYHCKLKGTKKAPERIRDAKTQRPRGPGGSDGRAKAAPRATAVSSGSQILVPAWAASSQLGLPVFTYIQVNT